MKAELARRSSNTQRLREFFEANPLKWINARDLEFAGRQAWRSRVSDVRKQLEAKHLGTIENRVQYPMRTVRDEEGDPARIALPVAAISEYRYLPHTPIGRDSTQETRSLPLFDADAGPWSR